MAKLKNPLLSLRASGSVSQALTFLRRRGVDLVERKPEIIDAQTAPQLAWRHMFNKCVDLWHALSVAEKAEWESAARSRHMTGYAWYISQCLRPNPGIYLPLQGGAMQGAIDMAKHRILKLPAPTDTQEAATKAYVDASSTPGREGARAYHDSAQSLAHVTLTTLAFNSERDDTNGIHDNVVNNSRLTCKTPGRYSIFATFLFETAGVYRITALIKLNATTYIAASTFSAVDGNESGSTICTRYALEFNDFVELLLIQASGAPLDVISAAQYSPEFMMQRIG